MSFIVRLKKDFEFINFLNKISCSELCWIWPHQIDFKQLQSTHYCTRGQ